MKGWKEPVRGEADVAGQFTRVTQAALANTETESNKNGDFHPRFY